MKVETSHEKPSHQMGGARKIKSCRHQDTLPVYNSSITIKASGVHHQGGPLEALKKGEKGVDNTPNVHCEPCQKTNMGPIPKHRR